MAVEVYLQGKKIILDEKKAEYGGEARVFLQDNMAIKIYHSGIINKRKEDKLRSFPKNIPENLIGPDNIIFNKNGNTIGFSMRAVKGAENFVMLSNRKFRENFPNEKIRAIFLNLLETLKEIHFVPLVVGDLNDLNLLFRDEEIFFIDADSMQFGRFPCEVATEQFLDPKLYGIDFSLRPIFTKESDFYSFSVLLFKSLLYVNPFGGVHPKFPTFLKRAEKRISVFQPEVRYPKAAIHFRVLPDEILDYFHQVFEKDWRGEFPVNLLENFRWTKCLFCGQIHARTICPYCLQKAPAAVKPIAMVYKKCLASVVFKTSGRIIQVKVEDGKIKLIYEENGKVMRENGEKVMIGNPDNFMRFSIMGDKTLLGRGKKIIIVEKEKIIKEAATGMLGNMAVFETTESDYFHLQGNLLLRSDTQIWGQILENQTWLKVGSHFGFGFYRLGLKTFYFLFDVRSPGLNDNLNLPQIKGQLVDVEAVFSDTYVLFLTSIMEKGKLINSMHLLDYKGNLIGSIKEEAENSKILSQIHNKTLGGNKILTATDEGLVLLEASQKIIKEVKIFTDTEPFVNNEVQLFTGQEGIYVISNQDVKLLKLV